jgi:drug/metabolite transporter (DMT)-like permease
MTFFQRLSPRDPVSRAILYMVGSTIVFAGVNAAVKWEVAIYPLGVVAVFRSFFALVVCGMLILPKGGIAVWRTRRIGAHIWRGVAQFGSMLCIFMAFRLMSLTGAMALSFSAPLFTTLLSIIVLKEVVGLHRWSALVVGFVGVLIVTQPGADSLQAGAFFAVGNALMISIVSVAIRRMSATESVGTLTLYQMAIITLCTLAMLPFGMRMPDWRNALLLIATGLGNGVGQYWWTKSLAAAPTSIVVPFNYLSLVWAAILGFAIWGEIPDRALLIGSAIVIGSGLYILWREGVRRRRALAPVALVTPAR